MSKKKNHKQSASPKVRPVKMEKAEAKVAAPSGEVQSEQTRQPRFRSPAAMLTDFRKLTKEEQLNRGTLLVLILWMLLPVWAFLLYLISWLTIGRADAVDALGLNHVYRAAFQYAASFRVLGIVTVFMVLAHLLAFPRSTWHLKKVARREPWFDILLFLLVWALVGTVLSENSFKAFSGSPLQYDGFTSYVIFAAIFLLAFFLTGEGKRLVVLRVCTGVANFCVLLMLAQGFQWPGLYELLFRTNSSVFFNSNHFAYYLSVSIVILGGLLLFDRGKKRSVWYMISYLFQIYGLFLNNTLGSILPVPVALAAVYLFYWRRGRRFDLWTAVPVVGLVGVGALFLCGVLPSPEGARTFAQDFFKTTEEVQVGQGGQIANSAGSGRMRLYREAIKIFPEHPIVGFGPNSMPDYYDAKLTRPHNTVLQMLVFHGIPGAVAYCGALITLAVRQFRRLKKLDVTTLIAMAAVIQYVISAMFGVPMFYTSIYFFFMLALAAGRPDDDPLQGER